MKDDDITREQMTMFCDQARRAVAAERVVLVASVEGHTNLCASMKEGHGGTTETEVLSHIVADLARAIMSIHPTFSVTISSPDSTEQLVFDPNEAGMAVTQRVVEEVDDEVG
jgi:hypothetical protein